MAGLVGLGEIMSNKRAQVDSGEKIQIPDISSRETLVRVVDELKYRLKARVSARLVGPHKDNMLEDFNLLLNKFIKSWLLDSDPHSFATLPSISGDIPNTDFIVLPIPEGNGEKI